MLCCIGGVCVPYTAVVPLLLLAVRWCLAKLARLGLVPGAIVKMMNLQEMQSSSSCCKESSSTTRTSTTTTESYCAAGSSTVQELESEEEFHRLLNQGGKVVVKFTARYVDSKEVVRPYIGSIGQQN